MRHANAVRSRRWTALMLAACAWLCAASAAAQEVEKAWKTNDPSTRATERAAQVDLEAHYAPYLPYGPFGFEIQGQIAAADKTIYRYGIKSADVVRTPWVYNWLQTDYASEDAMLAAMKSAAPSSSGCPATTVAGVGQWTGVPGGGAGAGANGEDTGQLRSYQRTTYGGSGCQAYSDSQNTSRTRQVNCPNSAIMAWRPELNACGINPVRETALSAFLYYWSAPLPKQCDGGGDPSSPGGCNPITGDKSESETDLDLGWISFGRTYHSFTSTAGGAFGPAWTYSHNIRLAMGVDKTVNPSNTTLSMGLIEADGHQLAFQPLGGTQYEAMDGSGDRIVQGTNLWTLYRPDRVMSFDADGRLTQQRFEDGTSLTYAYDARHRLATITHSSGRKLELGYGSNPDSTRIETLIAAGTTLVSYGYNANEQVTTATYAGGGVRTYHYESPTFPYNLTGITAEDSQRLAWFEYDAKGRIATSKLAGDAEKWVLGYPATGGAVVTNPLGQTTDYSPAAASPNGLPDKIGETDDTSEGTGKITRTYYGEAQDFRRRLSTLTDRNGALTQFTYGQITDPVTNAAAGVRTIQEAVGDPETRTTEERRDLASNRLILTTTATRETRILRNVRLQPSSVTVKDTASGATRTINYAYCEPSDVSVGNSPCPILGLLKAVDGPRPDTDALDKTTFVYYGSDDVTCDNAPATCPHRRGDLWKVTDAAGHVTEMLKYDAQGRLLSMKDANGVVTDSEYNARGWRMAVKVRGTNDAVESDDLITRTDYWPTGQVKQITRPDGVSWKYDYDAAQRLTRVTDAASFYTQYTLDGAGNRWKDEIKYGTAVYMKRERGFDAFGRQTADNDRDPVDFAYDGNGNRVSATDGLGHLTQYGYDALNRPTLTKQDAGPGGVAAQTLLSYDALDHLVQVNDPKGLNTVYTYNALGDLTQLSSPDTGTTTATFDAAGNRKTWTDARNVTGTVVYDALNRPTGVTYGGSDPRDDAAYVYDTPVAGVCAADEVFGQGRLSQVRTGPAATPVSTVQYCYDRFGRTTRKVQTMNGKAYTLRYAYTKFGDLQSVTYPDGMVVTYGYNTGTPSGTGRLNTIGVKLAGTTTVLSLIGSINNYPSGPQLKWTYGNGRVLNRSHDDNYRPTAINDTAVGGVQMGLGYDAAGRLNSLFEPANPAVEKLHYDYDGLDRLTATRDGTTLDPVESYAYDPTGNRTSVTFTDANLQPVTQAYAYPTGSHRLASVADVGRSYDNAGNTTAMNARTFTYSPAGRLREVSGSIPIPMSYTYNGLGEQVRRYPTAAPTGAQDYYVYDEQGHWIGSYDVNGAMKQQIVWLEGYPVGLVNASGLKYIEPDHLGTPRAVIEVARNVAVWKWDAKSEAFGNALPIEDPDGDTFKLVFDMRFPGQRFDAATGMNYNYFRDYDAGTGRYGQSDPIGLGGGISTYAYVSGNPSSLYDPYGLDIWLEGPSGPEPPFHMSVSVGDPNGIYHSFSFAMNGWGLEGAVYYDAQHGGKILKYKLTTDDQEYEFYKKMRSMEGQTAMYGSDDICITWSERQFRDAPGIIIEPPKVPINWR